MTLLIVFQSLTNLVFGRHMVLCMLVTSQLFELQVFIGKIPKNAFEDEIVPLLEQCGIIWDFRLMLEPGTGKNRGFGFCSFVTKDEAEKCVEKARCLHL